MIASLAGVDDRLKGLLKRLIARPVKDYYNPYGMFEWSEQLPQGMWWMTPSLMAAGGAGRVARKFPISLVEGVEVYGLNFSDQPGKQSSPGRHRLDR